MVVFIQVVWCCYVACVFVGVVLLVGQGVWYVMEAAINFGLLGGGP